MIEYKVLALETGGVADIEKACNDLAKRSLAAREHGRGERRRHRGARVAVLRAGVFEPVDAGRRHGPPCGAVRHIGDALSALAGSARLVGRMGFRR